MANLGTRPRTPSNATTTAPTRRCSAPRPPGVPLCSRLRLAALRPALRSPDCHPSVCRRAVSPPSRPAPTARSAVRAEQRQWVRRRGQRRPLAAFFPALFFPVLFFAALRGLLLPFASAWSRAFLPAFLPAFFLSSAAASAATTTVSAGDPDAAARDFLPLAFAPPPSTAADPGAIATPSARVSRVLNPVPARKTGTTDAPTLIASPVRGLRPRRGARSRRSKVPNPLNETRSPRATLPSISSNTPLTAATAVVRSPLSRSVILAMRSDLFTGASSISWQHGAVRWERTARSPKPRYPRRHNTGPAVPRTPAAAATPDCCR